MTRPFIVMGDKTSHGGTVITADLTSLIDGKPMARVGDLVVCPRCKGVFRIKTGTDNMRDEDGNGYARHLDITDCGAHLISSQVTAGWSNESSLGDPAFDAKAEALDAASRVAESTGSGICLACLRKAAHLGSSTVIRE